MRPNQESPLTAVLMLSHVLEKTSIGTLSSPFSFLFMSLSSVSAPYSGAGVAKAAVDLGSRPIGQGLANPHGKQHSGRQPGTAGQPGDAVCRGYYFRECATNPPRRLLRMESGTEQQFGVAEAG